VSVSTGENAPMTVIYRRSLPTLTQPHQYRRRLSQRSRFFFSDRLSDQNVRYLYHNRIRMYRIYLYTYT
jgi:hypothetical protein